MGRYEDVDLTEAVKQDRRTQLESIRDYLAHELEGNRCNQCRMSQLRTGDTAALILRLTKVLEEIDALPREDGKVTPLDAIRGKLRLAGSPAPTDPAPPSQHGNTGS